MLAPGHRADDDNRPWEMCRSGQLSTPSGDPQESCRDAAGVTSHSYGKLGPLPTPRITLLSTGQLVRPVCLQGILQGRAWPLMPRRAKASCTLGCLNDSSSIRERPPWAGMFGAPGGHLHTGLGKWRLGVLAAESQQSPKPWCDMREVRMGGQWGPAEHTAVRDKMRGLPVL